MPAWAWAGVEEDGLWIGTDGTDQATSLLSYVFWRSWWNMYKIILDHGWTAPGYQCLNLRPMPQDIRMDMNLLLQDSNS